MKYEEDSALLSQKYSKQDVRHIMKIVFVFKPFSS